MNAPERYDHVRLRHFLHALALVMFLGIIVELVAAKHYESLVQLIPFGLCVLGAVGAVVSWQRDAGRWTMAALRAAWLMMVAGSILGVYEHLEENFGFVRETQPHASTFDVLQKTFQGRDPVLAPLALIAAGAVALAASMIPRTVLREQVTRSRARTSAAPGRLVTGVPAADEVVVKR